MQVSVTLRNEISEIERLSAAISRFWAENRLPPDLEADMSLALEEVVANVILHGYQGGGEHQVRVKVALEGGLVSAAVEDEGVAFNPLEAPEPDLNRPLEERRVGGLGIHLVRNLMDALEYRREGKRNILVMKKRVR